MSTTDRDNSNAAPPTRRAVPKKSEDHREEYNLRQWPNRTSQFDAQYEREAEGVPPYSAEHFRIERNAQMRVYRRRLANAVERARVRIGWSCSVCGDPMPTGKRADAKFCSERCRSKFRRIQSNSFNNGEPE